jgi:hypothetical protein
MTRFTILALVALLGSYSLAIAGQEASPVADGSGPGISITIELDPDDQPQFVIHGAETPAGNVAWDNLTGTRLHLEIDQEGVITTKVWIYPNDIFEKQFHQSGIVRFRLIDIGEWEEIRV